MAQIKQVGIGRKSTGTIDGITYYVRNGKTFARSAPNMPASAYTNPEARTRQAIFKMVQQHMKLHLRTIRQTITATSGSPSNRYYSLNKKGLSAALQTLAEQYVAGEDVTITDIEQAIADYAAEHPTSIKIASKSGYAEVYLTGPWPEKIVLNALSGDSTIIVIVNEYGVQTTINADGTTTVETYNGSTSGSGSTVQGSGSGSGSGHTDSTDSTDSGSGSSTGGTGSGTETGGGNSDSGSGSSTGSETGGGSGSGSGSSDSGSGSGSGSQSGGGSGDDSMLGGE